MVVAEEALVRRAEMTAACALDFRDSQMDDRSARANAPIHIVEDDSAVSDSLSMLLRQLGHSVHAYPDAESFFARGIPSPDETVVVDLALPGMDGAQLIQWLQSLRAPPRIVVITGQNQARLDRMMQGLSVPYVIRKPLSEDAISAFI